MPFGLHFAKWLAGIFGWHTLKFRRKAAFPYKVAGMAGWFNHLKNMKTKKYENPKGTKQNVGCLGNSESKGLPKNTEFSQYMVGFDFDNTISCGEIGSFNSPVYEKMENGQKQN